MKKQTWFQKYWRQLLLVLVVVFLVFYVAVFHDVWADRNYRTNFWPHFFKWSAGIIGGGLLVAWALSWFGGKRK